QYSTPCPTAYSNFVGNVAASQKLALGRIRLRPSLPLPQSTQRASPLKHPAASRRPSSPDPAPPHPAPATPDAGCSTCPPAGPLRATDTSPSRAGSGIAPGNPCSRQRWSPSAGPTREAADHQRTLEVRQTRRRYVTLGNLLLQCV